MNIITNDDAFDTGFRCLAWHELQGLRLVSKGFQLKIDEITPTWPGWEVLVKALNDMNGFNRCSDCEKEGWDCDCGAEFCSHRDDPRVESGFRTLSPYEQFQPLLAFHQHCIANLLSFFPDDLSASYSNGTEMHWFYENGLSILQETNPQLMCAMGNVVSLSLATGDLSCPPYWYRSAFEGLELDPATGSSHRDAFCANLDALVTLHHPACILTENAISGCFGDDGNGYYKSQFEHLDESMLNFCGCTTLTKCAALFGPLAESIDVFGKHRAGLHAMLSELFPLKWMPVLGGTPEAYEEALKKEKQKRKRESRASARDQKKKAAK